MDAVAWALIVVAFAFAWSMGAHYTGACMGMPYAARTIRLWPALALMAVLTLLGATFLSHGVLATVGHGIIRAQRIDPGAGLARGCDTVRWPVITGILKGWVVGPAAGFALGYLAALAVQLAGE